MGVQEASQSCYSGNGRKRDGLGRENSGQIRKKHAASRKPLARFLEIVRTAEWPHFPAVKKSFPATDYAPETETLIFDISGNKYRLIAKVDFEERVLLVQTVLTHEEYSREIL
jgi:mRNA interferase HigB